MAAIIANLGTILVCLLLAAIVALIIFVLRRDKRAGRCSCGCGCGACPMRDSCHAPKESASPDADNN